MKRFVFRLDAVLRQRRAVLEARRADLAEVFGRRAFAEQLLAQRLAALDTLVHPPSTGALIDPARELLRQHHLGALRDEIERRRRQIQQLDEAIERARAAVTDAHREQRAMEILEERDRAAWLAETRRVEQTEIDERNSLRFNRD